MEMATSARDQCATPMLRLIRQKELFSRLLRLLGVTNGSRPKLPLT
jgi:hypothetical protein